VTRSPISTRSCRPGPHGLRRRRQPDQRARRLGQGPGNASTYGDNTSGLRRCLAVHRGLRERLVRGCLAALGSKAAVETYLAQFDVWDRNDFDNDGNSTSRTATSTTSGRSMREGEDAGGGVRARMRSGRTAGTSTRMTLARLVRTITSSSVAPGSATPTLDRRLHGRGGERRARRLRARVRSRPRAARLLRHERRRERHRVLTLMSSGSWMNEGTEDIGPSRITWARGRSSSSAGSTTPSSLRTRTAQPPLAKSAAVIVDVPDVAAVSNYTTAYSGTHAWWTSSADDLNTTLQRSVDLSASRPRR
jgi:immune inhibitor A